MPTRAQAVRSSDRRSLLLLIFAVGPVLVVVWYSAQQWQRAVNDLNAVSDGVAPVTAIYEGYAFLDRLGHTTLVRSAAALDDSGDEITDLARADATTILVDLQTRHQAFTGDINGFAASVDASAERTSELSDFALTLSTTTLARHRIGDPLPITLQTVTEQSRQQIVDVALARLASGDPWLRDAEQKLFELIRLDAAHNRDLLRVMGGPAAQVDLELATPRQLRWNDQTQSWDQDRVGSDDDDVNEQDFRAPSVFDVPNPIGSPIAELALLDGSADPDERDRWILEAIRADLDLTLLASEAHAAVLEAAQGERDRIRGERRLAAAFGVVMILAGLGLFVLVLNEVRERRRVRDAHDDALNDMRELANRDSLTGLRNRRWLDDELGAMLAAARDVPVLVAYIDVDRFKGVNDVWGHPVGDQVLQTIARRLSRAAWPHNLELVRFGGDEFIALGVAQQATDEERLAHIGDRLLAAFNDPIVVDGTAHEIEGSVGLTASDAQSTTHSLLLEADLSLLEAKREGRGRAVVHRRGHDNVYRLVQALPSAFAEREFRMELQPVVSTDDGSVHHYEALARWTRSDGTSVPPDVFVPLIESFGFTTDLTRAMVWNVREARSLDPTLPRIWINVSPVEFNGPDLSGRLLRMLAEFDLSPDAIGVEVTERAAIGDLVGVETELQRLREHGIPIAIDDFGSGYSPLGHLRALPLDVLKIDRILVDGIDTDTGARQMVRGIIGFARSLGLSLVAEGVERPEELALLEAEGVEMVQGWLTGRPEPAETVAQTRNQKPPAVPGPVNAPMLGPIR